MPMNLGRLPKENLKEIRISLKDFSGGVNKLVEETRLKEKEAVEALNLVLVQDGVWKQRWGTDYYTPAIAGVNDIDGFAEYVKTDDTRELIIAGDDGKIYKSVDGGAATEISGGTLTGGITTRFLQIDNNLYIYNGTDNLLRYGGSTLSSYTARSAPAWAGTPLARTGLSSGNYTYYYQITTLNGVGESLPNTEQSITVDEERSGWDSSNYITLDWSAATGATQYQIYIGDESGYLRLVKTVQAGVTTWDDTGVDVINTYIDTPDDDTTGGPKFADMCVSNNRAWATKDPDNKFRVHFTGTGIHVDKFSDYYGGGWIDLEKGGREEPVKVIHYQDGLGAGKLTVVCKTPEGTGSIWQIGITSVTVESDTFSVPSAAKIVGSVGTSAPDSVILAKNNVWMANKRGIHNLGPEKNYYGILRTNELSHKIRPYWRSLVASAMDGICAYEYDAKIFFSVPTSSTTNDRTIYYDWERRAWVIDWTIGAKQFGEYTDSDGTTHFLASEDGSDRIIRISDSIKGDKGASFATSYLSPRFIIDNDWTEFAKIRKAFIRLGSPVGTLSFKILGTERNGNFSSVISKDITATYSLTGLGWDKMATVQLGDTEGSPTTFSQSSDIRYMKVNKKLRDLQFQITSNDVNAEFEILGIKAEGFLIKTTPLSDWKLN